MTTSIAPKARAPPSPPSQHPYGSNVYGSRYQDRRGLTPSRSHLRFSRTPTD